MNVTEYQKQIDTLQKHIYPMLHQSLNNISAGDTESFSDVLNGTIPAFQKEFRSLEAFEKKLIFPAILSIFTDHDHVAYTVPDIDAIVNLTDIREERLKKGIEKISEVTNGLQHNNKGKTKKQEEVIKELVDLTDIFYNSFLPQKKIWKEMLAKLNKELVG